ncbi:hypothetical protein ACI1VO_31015, partial [Escherichia coli]
YEVLAGGVEVGQRWTLQSKVKWRKGLVGGKVRNNVGNFGGFLSINKLSQ